TGAGRRREGVPAWAGARPPSAPLAARVRDPQLRDRDVPVGGPEIARSRVAYYDSSVPGHRHRRPRARQPGVGQPGRSTTRHGQGESAMKWNLRWAAARRDIWRPSDLLVALRDVGFQPP